MPAVNQSLVPYNPLGRPNYGDGTSYTNSIDAALAVGGQISGAYAVVPNSPAAMSVLVDGGYNSIVDSLGVYIQAGGPPTAVALVAPGTNSRYSTIYYDKSANTYGVVNGVSGVSPVPICTSTVAQIPLALVLVPSTATSITATMIYDIRNMLSRSIERSIILSTTISIDCQWTAAIDVFAQVTAAASIILSNLRDGTRISCHWFNNTGGVLSIGLQGSQPNGTVYTCLGQTASGVTQVMQTTFPIAAGTHRHFTGVAFAGNSIYGILL
jgi:hypothetical protein